MNKKDILIKVTSEIVQNDQKDNIEFTTEGKYYKKNGKEYLSYDESVLSGMEGNSIILIVDNNKLTMNRYGSNKSKMIFDLENISFTDYHTPYGNFEMEIITNKLDINIEKGYIKVDYNINVKGLSNGKNKLLIEIK